MADPVGYTEFVSAQHVVDNTPAFLRGPPLQPSLVVNVPIQGRAIAELQLPATPAYVFLSPTPTAPQAPTTISIPFRTISAIQLPATPADQWLRGPLRAAQTVYRPAVGQTEFVSA